MKDSQQPLPHADLFPKYIKANNERFSTVDDAVVQGL